MSTETATSTKTYTIDPAHSTARFWVRHLMVSKVHGTIDDITGTVSFNEGTPASAKVDVSLNVASLSTGQEQRDGHLKSADFFDIEKFPAITFVSTGITAQGNNEYDVVGDLTIHGTTHSITLRAEASEEVPNPYGGFKIGVSATGVINRDDFGVSYNQALEAGGVMIGKEVHLTIDAELDRPA